MNGAKKHQTARDGAVWGRTSSIRTKRAWPGASPGLPSVIGARGIVHRLEGFLELRRDRDVEPTTGRQPPHEPFLVKRGQIVVGAKLAEGALHHGGELWLTLAEH